ncbi:hypothetical protein [Geochorda subterranea]|uniref:Iron-sulfur cluster loop n=1 Tax=Geochorda subterranea TaxID=3109564 RepID=A0ABZ1BQW6_9FIRM|nr:hypothetical protein [Limnochorda sp. LNt]WRP15212.1 hypothetical protein VLY81_03310 [Limnochorda sp. LNt]
MTDLDRYPPEVRLLAEMVRLGDSARRLLAQAHLLGVTGREALHRMAPEPDEERDATPSVARLLIAYWAGRPPLASLTRYGETIDPTCAQGRWELLALAVLLGAPVPRDAAEATFCQLRAQGLLDLTAAARSAPEWAEAVEEVMTRSYRGRVDRGLQRRRLAAAAQGVQTRWAGDLDGVWEAAGRDAGRAVTLLREGIGGIDRMAAWLVREMGRLGVWPGAHRHAAAFFADPFLREAAVNLGLVTPAQASGSRPHLERRLRDVVSRHFAGDSTVLSSHGRAFCHARNPAVCLSRCPVSRYCRAWDGGHTSDTGEEAGGSSTGS